MEMYLSCIEIKTSCSVIPVLNYWQEWFETLTEARRLVVMNVMEMSCKDDLSITFTIP